MVLNDIIINNFINKSITFKNDINIWRINIIKEADKELYNNTKFDANVIKLIKD